MGDTVKAAIITGIFTLIVGVWGGTKIIPSTVTVNVGDQKMSVTAEENQNMYDELKKGYDSLSLENQNLKDELVALKKRNTYSERAS